MGFIGTDFPVSVRGVMLMLSRRGFVVAALLVAFFMVFTLGPSGLVPGVAVTDPGARPRPVGYEYGVPAVPHGQIPPEQQRPQGQIQQGDEEVSLATHTVGEMPTVGTLLPQTLDQPPRRLDPVCDGFPAVGNILLIMKTGASEAYARVPMQLMTTLRCLPEYFIYSDKEQVISGYHVRDSLDTVKEETMSGNADFTLYQRQKQCDIDQMTCTERFSKGRDTAEEGWNLDKYKNIHIAEKVYELKPNYDWYVTVDADTYVLWPTLVQWLQKLDARKPLYLGSVTMLAGFPFAHGGSGYILSQGAMKEYVGKHKGIANEYEDETSKVCCGDYMLALSLKDKTNIDVKQMWPTINGEKPFTIPFGKTHWCHAIATMHHLNAEELATMWDFETAFYRRPDVAQRPMLMKDIHEFFVEGRLSPLRTNWDNAADERFLFNKTAENLPLKEWERKKLPADGKLSLEEMEGWKSEQNCQKACASNGDCYMWRWHGNVCVEGFGWKVGGPRESDENGQWTSGWMVDRIKAFIEAQGECKKAIWPAIPS